MEQNTILCLILNFVKKKSWANEIFSLSPLRDCDITFTCPGNIVIDVGVYTAVGERIKTIVREFFPPGIHRIEWDGTDKFFNDLTNGTFEIRCKSGENIQIRKIIKLHQSEATK